MIDVEEFIKIANDISNITKANNAIKHHKDLVKKFYNSLPARYKNSYIDQKVNNHDDGKMNSMAEVFRSALLKRGESWDSKHILLSSEVQKALQKASHDHCKGNTHHPEFWQGIGEMDRNAIIEMVCDWAAVSYEINGNLKNMKSWYINTGLKRFRFPPRVNSLVLELIRVLGG